MVKLRVDPKTVQGILRHEDFGTTMDLYAQSDMEIDAGCAREVPRTTVEDKIHLLTGRVQENRGGEIFWLVPLNLFVRSGDIGNRTFRRHRLHFWPEGVLQGLQGFFLQIQYSRDRNP
jgi:hypothetical protein